MQLVIKKKTVFLAFLIIIVIAMVLTCISEGIKSNAEVINSESSFGTTAAEEEMADNADAASGIIENIDDNSFFVEYRIERDKIRGQRIEYLREIINNANSGAESRREAQAILLDIAEVMEKEMELENLIKARGFSDAAVCIQDEIITIILDAGVNAEVEKQDIMELVARSTGLEMADIDIITRNN